MPRPTCTHLGGCQSRSSKDSGGSNLCEVHYQMSMVELGAAEYWECYNPVHIHGQGEPTTNHEDRKRCRDCRCLRETYPQPQPLHGNDVGDDVVPIDDVINEPVVDDDDDDDDPVGNGAPDFENDPLDVNVNDANVHVGDNFAPDLGAVDDPIHPFDFGGDGGNYEPLDVNDDDNASVDDFSIGNIRKVMSLIFFILALLGLVWGGSDWREGGGKEVISSISRKTPVLVSPNLEELVGFDYRQQQPPDVDNVHVDGYEHDTTGLGGMADVLNEHQCGNPPLVFVTSYDRCVVNADDPQQPPNLQADDHQQLPRNDDVKPTMKDLHIWVLLIIGVVVSVLYRHADLQSREADLQSREADLQSQKKDLQSQKADLQSQKEDLQSQKEGLQSQKEDLQAQKEDLQSREAVLKVQKAALQYQKVDLQSWEAYLQIWDSDLQSREADVQFQADDANGPFLRSLILSESPLALPKLLQFSDEADEMV